MAQGYRKRLSGQSPSWSGDKTDPAFVKALKSEDYLGFDNAGQAIRAMEDHPDWADRWDVASAEKLEPLFDVHQQAKYGGSGHMYEVNVAADPEKFLHWDKPLSEQSQHVKDAIANSPLAGYEKTNLPGSQIVPHTAAGARKALASYGIPGIKYLDQGSRSAGEGIHNFVVFDPSTMEIIRRYGLAGLMGGGAAAGTAGSQKDDQ